MSNAIRKMKRKRSVDAKKNVMKKTSKKYAGIIPRENRRSMNQLLYLAMNVEQPEKVIPISQKILDSAMAVDEDDTSKPCLVSSELPLDERLLEEGRPCVE